MEKQTHYPTLESLQATQEWFAGIITNSLGEGDSIQTYGYSGCLIAEEAARYITPSPHLRPHQRMQIYNQQYWWRLFNTLHINFPLLTRLFGCHAFNEQIATPFLLKYPSNHWSLTYLGERLAQWVKEEYRAADQQLVYNAASLDWAFTASFISLFYSPLDIAHLTQDNLENLLTYTFYLQPHIHLFKWEYDLLTFRTNFIKKDVDYWVKHRFPKLAKGKTYHFILYRNSKNNIAWREVSQAEFILIERFKSGTTITDACDFLETQDEAIYEEAATHLQKWLQNWAQSGWLTLAYEPAPGDRGQA
jgi:hypothetical protein